MFDKYIKEMQFNIDLIFNSKLYGWNKIIHKS